MKSPTTKKELRECPKCQRKMRYRGYGNKALVTAAGEVIIRRFHCECVPCKHPTHPSYERIGSQDRYTLGARRLAALAGASWSFDKASQNIKEFSESHGEVEFTTDGTCVNTTDGWRVMNVAVFLRRELAKLVLPDQWESCHLPKPHKLWGVAAIESYEQFRRHWKHRAKFLGVDKSQLSVLADGTHSIPEPV